MRYLTAAACVMLAFTRAAVATESPHACLEGKPDMHRIESVSANGDVVTEDGDVLRTIGVTAADATRLAGHVRDRLNGKRVAAYGFGLDRYGRQMSHIAIKTPDEALLWLQELLIDDGHGIVHHQPEAGACARHLLLRENAARVARKGLWARSNHHILDANDGEEARRAIGAYRILEGRVLQVATVRGTTYLNFGEDWRSDMTLAASARSVRRLKANSIDLHTLEKKRICMRGFMIYRNGPMIELAHPEQLEFPIADPAKEAGKTD